MIYEAIFSDMGRAQVVGEVEADDKPAALKEARKRFAMKRLRPAARIFVRQKANERPDVAAKARALGIAGDACRFFDL
jgi:hypothetical protein